ncbi:MAG: hypothetical protein VXZ82_01905 [Planctomycetota bacterium]|nr:hypothetical protein [Planctomycetota bacterium]
MEAEDACFCQALLLDRRSLSRWLGYSGEWDTAANGMVMEQQRVVPTQNLAPVVGSLGLLDSLQQHSPQVARLCFELICKSLQIKKSHWHTMLITVKNPA